MHNKKSQALCVPMNCAPARQADEDLVRGRPRRGRLRLDARIDERVDDGRALPRHAPRAQAPPQRPLLAHQLLRSNKARRRREADVLRCRV